MTKMVLAAENSEQKLLQPLVYIYGGSLRLVVAPPCLFRGLFLLFGCHNQLQTEFQDARFFTIFVPYYLTLLLHFSRRKSAGSSVDIIGTSGF